MHYARKYLIMKQLKCHVSFFRRINMQTFILLTKLSPDVSKQMKDRAELGRAWLDRVKEKCPDVKFLDHYALLGPYDFIDIYQAPDAETAPRGCADTSTNLRCQCSQNG